MPAKRVIINVSGGLVQGVLADGDVEIFVVDWDNAETDETYDPILPNGCSVSKEDKDIHVTREFKGVY